MASGTPGVHQAGSRSARSHHRPRHASGCPWRSGTGCAPDASPWRRGRPDRQRQQRGARLSAPVDCGHHGPRPFRPRPTPRPERSRPSRSLGVAHIRPSTSGNTGNTARARTACQGWRRNAILIGLPHRLRRPAKHPLKQDPARSGHHLRLATDSTKVGSAASARPRHCVQRCGIRDLDRYPLGIREDGGRWAWGPSGSGRHPTFFRRVRAATHSHPFGLGVLMPTHAGGSVTSAVIPNRRW